MGNSPSAVEKCLTSVCGGRSGCVGFPSNPLYQITWVKPYNLDSAAAVTPVAVVRPNTAQEISGVIQCATTNNLKIQAKSGGHSYANYGLGGPGQTTTIAIDMINFNEFSMDTTTWRATIGAGNQLGDVTKKLHDNGKRAMAHGICPGVGIGGHATIGGLGAMSRMWGSCLDHVLEVEVVTADGTIQRASESQNPELFFALKGAAASFGVITKFVMKTHPEPGEIVQYSYSFAFGSARELASTFKTWQTVIGNPSLDRRFGSQIIITPIGAIIEGTFYGTLDQFKATGIPAALPQTSSSVITVPDWLGALAHDAETEALYLSNLQIPFYSKSLGFRQEDLLSDAGINAIFNFIASNDPGTIGWAIIFDLEGGAINDVPMNATAYAHRDKTMFYQSYAVGIPGISQTTRNFLTGFHDTILNSVGKDRDWTVYAGYVDPALGPNAQPMYWGSNYPTLQTVKSKWDPNDVFHNPQSVRPSAQIPSNNSVDPTPSPTPSINPTSPGSSTPPSSATGLFLNPFGRVATFLGLGILLL